MTGRALTEVAPGVHVATSGVMQTTSTVITGDGGDGGVLLVDPAWVPSELAGLAEEVSSRGWTVLAGFATHAHHDHLLWHPGLGDAPRLASPRTAELAASERSGLVEHLGEGWPPELVDLMGRVSGTDVLDAGHRPGGVEVELVVHDGHAPGHTALWLPATRVLIAGDMLSDLELPLPFHPDDLPAYLAGLDTLAPYAARARVVVPGHGAVGHGPAAADRLDADRRYLDDVAAGRRPDDPRLGNPGMQEEYEHLLTMVRDG